MKKILSSLFIVVMVCLPAFAGQLFDNVKITGTLTNNGVAQFNSTLNGVFPATFPTNITSTTLTVTGQGTHIFNLETPIVNPQTVSNITSSSLTITGQGTKIINIETPLVNAQTITNITGDANAVFSGQGTKNFTLTINYGIFLTNGAAATLSGLTVNGNSTLGVNSSSTLTLTGTTITAPSGNVYNGGVWTYPASVAGVSSNQGGIFTTGNISAGGQIGAGPGGIVSPQAQFHAVFTNQVPTGIDFLADVYGPTNTPTFIGRRARGTITAPSAIQLDDLIAAFNGRGYGSTAFSTNSKGAITIHASENWSDTSQGTYIRLMTTSNGTTTITEAVRVDNLGNVGIGTTNITSKLTIAGGLALTATDLWARWTAGSNTNFFENGGGTVPKQTSFTTVTMTNMPNGAQFSNTGNFYTNIQQQATVRFTVVLPSTATQVSSMGIFHISGGYTNIESIVSSSYALNGVVTNTMATDLNPGDTFFPTNTLVTGGTPSLAAGRSVITFK